jgi:MraZ protein
VYESGRKWKMLFLGMYNHSVDSKNRLVLPSKFISKLSESIYISIGFDGCLEIRNEKDFKEYSEKLLELPNTSRDARQIQRVFLSLSSKVEVDGSKRVLVPVNLLQKASIDKDVMIIGVGKTIEI